MDSMQILLGRIPEAYDVTYYTEGAQPEIDKPETHTVLVTAPAKGDAVQVVFEQSGTKGQVTKALLSWLGDRGW